MTRTPGRRLLVVSCGLIYFFLMLPLLVVFPISLSSAPYMQFPPPGLSWQWYERYLDDPQWIDATWRSLYIGSATAVFALALGVPLAFALVRGKFFGRILIDRLALAPVIVPTIILSVAVYGLFAKLKLIGTWYGLVIAHTVLALPFVVLVIGAGLRDFDRSLEQAAEGLGASRWRTLARITLPLLRPSLVSAGLLAFISSFDVPGRREHDPAQEDVRQHHDGDRPDHRRRLGDADPAGVGRAGADRPLRPGAEG